MDMTEIDNQLLERFFEPARNVQLEDRGFTNSVMKRLPDQAIRLSHWWTAFCVVVGLLLFVVFKGWEPLLIGVWTTVRMLVTNVHPVPFFLTMGVLSCLALLELAHRMERMQI